MRTRAFVVRSVDFGDADRIVTFLTEDLGKISALARGARRSKRRFAGSLETTCLLEVDVVSGRGELARLAEARVVRSYPGTLGDLRKLALVGVGLELVRAVCPEGERDEDVFLTMERWMSRADAALEGVAELTAAFQIRVLTLAGFAPGVEVCARSGLKASPGRSAMFDPRFGSIVSTAEGGGTIKLSASAREYTGVAQTEDWSEVSVPWTRADLGAIRRMIREHCAVQVGCRLEAWSVLTQVEELM